MQTTAKGVRKELKQIITVYQGIIEFSLEKMWLDVIVKHNKADADAMLDDINVKLIEVCEEYLATHNIGLDKYQLAMVVMDLYTKTISELEAPFKIIAKESKTLVQEYLEKNKSKREALERIQKENDTLDKEIAVKEKERKEKKVALLEKPEMPSGNLEAGGQGKQPPTPKPKVKRKWTDTLAVDNFYIPWVK